MKPIAKRYQEGLEQGQAEGLIKVGIPINSPKVSKEWVWAEIISPSVVRIKNVPFFALEVGYGDTVLVEGKEGFQREFIRVINHVNDTVVLLYDKHRAKETYSKIAKYFKDKGWYIEGGVAGMAALAIPCETSPTEIVAVVEACPIQVTIQFPEEE